jgi:hypothetical protein
MATKLGIECSAIAFYGFSATSEVRRELYERLVAWFQSLNCPAERMGVSGKGFGEKVGKFAPRNAKLQRVGFQAVTSFDLHSLLPGGKDQIEDGRLEACFDFEHPELPSFAFVQGRSPIVGLTKNSLLVVAQFVVDLLKPDYGIGYHRPYHLGPGWYAMGLSHGLGYSDAEREERRTISRWADIGMTEEKVYRQGLLRDVYPWNFLTSFQVSAKVEGYTLKGWIERDEKRGQLTQMNEKVLLWSLTDPQIARVRPILWREGRLFDYRKYLD